MNKLSFIFILFLCGNSFTCLRAQDFSIDELKQLRTSSLSNFETVAMGKGYILNDIDKEYDHFATFKKGHNTISYGLIKNEHFQQTDTEIIYIMTNEAEYNKLKSGIKENPAHHNKTHFFKNETHILHVNQENDIVVHFFTKFNERPLYEVEVTTGDADKYKH